MRQAPCPHDTQNPLVSVCIFNYNYGIYLAKCVESVANQSYANIEICFSDNASDDESWDIINALSKKYPEFITMTRNRKNFGSDANFENCKTNIRGKYFMELCSDDALAPDFILRCVAALEKHPEASFALVHRSIIDNNGHETFEQPFYNQSCIIPGPEQAAVYMMASVNPSVSQIVYNTGRAINKIVKGGFATRWYGTRIMDFNLCTEAAMVYIKDPLLKHRLHLENDSFRAADNLMEVIGPYVLQLQFSEIARIHDLEKAASRLPASLKKVGDQALRYAVRALERNDETTALRYFHLAPALSPAALEDPTFQTLSRYWAGSTQERTHLLATLGATPNLVSRTHSYDPPPGSLPLEPVEGAR